MSVFVKGPLAATLTDPDGYAISASTPIPVNPAESGAANYVTGQTAVTTSATLIAAARALRRGILVTNTHATNILYVGSASVTVGTGKDVPPGQSVSLPIIGAIYGIGSGSLTATWIEVYD